MKIAYGDVIGGISGDMFVAALLSLGLPLRTLQAELKKIPTLRFKLQVSKEHVHGIEATRIRVGCPDGERPRSWKQIRKLIRESTLNPNVKETGGEIFARLAEAEGKIHGIAADAVHFHEIGATDSIVDIIAAAIGVHELQIANLQFSRIPLGHGITRSRHGHLPVPAPATLELLRGIPVVGIDLDGETVTPTGAAIVSTLGTSFGAQPEMIVDRIGYGTGEKDWPDRPNLFRLVIGSNPAAWNQEEMLVLETNIDDMNPEFYDHVLDRLFAAGARDVFLSAIQMKKNRPGTMITVIAGKRDRESLAGILFSETSTIGVRYYPVSRIVLKRTTKTAETRYGVIRIKEIEEPDGTKRATPEYDDLKRIASARKIPLRTLHDEVLIDLRANQKEPAASTTKERKRRKFRRRSL